MIVLDGATSSYKWCSQRDVQSYSNEFIAHTNNSELIGPTGNTGATGNTGPPGNAGPTGDFRNRIH